MTNGTKFVITSVTLFLLLLLACIGWYETGRMLANYKAERCTVTAVYEPEEPIIVHDHITETTYDLIKYSKDWSTEEEYMLAKIAMAEAEGESIETKILVILTVLNRVDSGGFPDTIEEVIFQNSGGVYQFSPVVEGGRWWITEPNDECWEAISTVKELRYDISQGALFFESCEGESWHSRNLEFICKSDNMRFYK